MLQKLQNLYHKKTWMIYKKWYQFSDPSLALNVGDNVNQ